MPLVDTRGMKKAPHRFNRRRLLFGAGAVAVPAAVAVDGLLVTPRRLVTTTHVIAGPDAGGPTVRIVQVTDLHMTTVGGLNETLLERLHEAKPDLIVLTGDMIERPEHLAALDTFLGQLPDVLTFAVLGNWEYWSGVPTETYRRLYDAHAIELLVNRSTLLAPGTIGRQARPLRITGLDDLAAGRPDPHGSLDSAETCPHHLLLAHCPASRDACPLPAEHAPSLILSGHTHGGQIAPFGLAVVLPPGSGRYVAGWYRDGGPPLYVCRGIGTSMLPVRIGATPELAVFDWSL